MSGVSWVSGSFGSRTTRGVLLSALVMLAAAVRPLAAGTIAPDLQVLMNETSPRRRIPVVIRLGTEADITAAAAGAQTRAECVRAVVAVLKQHAAATQNVPTVGRPLGLLDELRQFEGTFDARDVESFWIDNAVAVSATAPVIQDCAARADVSTVIYGGVRSTPAPRAQTAVPQWNVSRVRAPEVWDSGIRGAGALVAAIDTGANAAHPALESNLLRDAAGLPIWRDAVRGRPTPYDDSGHGSHVLGIAVGADGIGVAPDAKWIACKGLKRGPRGTIRRETDPILRCAQWVLNPDDPADPDPAHIPDVVVNAWWNTDPNDPGSCDPFLQKLVRAWRACGILPVFAAGNDPSGVAPADAVPSPANYPEAFSVGATDAIDEPVTSSFHGTAACGGPGRPAPRLLAPGIDITSAWKGRSVGKRSGTDAAAPHAAGAAALLRSAFPDLSVDRIDEVLERSARGFMPGPPHRPGLLDAFAAVTFEDARFVNHAAPAGTQVTEETVSVTVVMRNSGVTTWQRGVHRLAPVPDLPTWGITRVDLPAGRDTVAPHDPPVAFTFDVTVPQVPNLNPGYRFQWQMLHEGEGFFGDPSPLVMVPVRGFSEAEFKRQVAPPQLVPNQCVPVSVTFENKGTNPWTAAAGYRLRSENPTHNATWGITHVNLGPSEVFPFGSEKTFAFTACAPAIQGSYPFQWRIEQNEGGFGQLSNSVQVRVEGADQADACGSTGFPAELRVGRSADVTICMRNPLDPRNNTWMDDYCLASLQGSTWGPSRICLNPGAQVSPGQQHIFSFRITAPNSPGRLEVKYQMENEEGDRFGQLFTTTIGIPLDYQARACWDDAQPQCGWTFRHHEPDGWHKMSFVTDHWQGPGALQQIFPTWAHPGNERVARFWKSPHTGLIRVTGEVHDLDGNCGDGIQFLLKKNRGTNSQLFETIVPNGDATPHTFTIPNASITSLPVVLGDTIRFMVGERANNNCDATFLDPLIQVLPPDTVGLIAAPQTTPDPDVEPD